MCQRGLGVPSHGVGRGDSRISSWATYSIGHSIWVQDVGLRIAYRMGNAIKVETSSSVITVLNTNHLDTTHIVNKTFLIQTKCDILIKVYLTTYSSKGIERIAETLTKEACIILTRRLQLCLS